MSGGGASPAIKKNAVLSINASYYGSVAVFVIGGRARIAAKKDANGNIVEYLSRTNQSSSVLFFYSQNYAEKQAVVKTLVDNLAAIYGTVDYDFTERSKTLEIGNVVIDCDNDYVELNNLYAQCGFVEGQARIITDYGNIACIVKNGTLYPIITEYDQQIEDNKCLTSLYLNGDNEVSGLQDMVDHPGRYLPYDNTTVGEPWSPVENYLHQNVNMPIVPKIGFEPSPDVGIGNILPGLNYEVTL